jgi:hypothetical protein
MRFTDLSPADYRVISGLMYGDLSLLRQVRLARQRVRSILSGTAQVFVWGVKQAVRSAYFLVFRRSPKAATAPATAA